MRRALLFGGAALVIVVLAVVGGSYLWLNCELGDTEVTTTGEIGGVVADPVDPPEGMDILVLGSDKHPDNAGEESRSDTVMLVHVDPDAEYLSILSLPRDLQVEIPGHGTDKLNAAYSLGGWELTAETVGQLTKVQIDEYLEVDFQAFSDITDQLGGVYVDVDRRYYNNAADSKYELISVSPGYQLLNGADALDYVRFRHDNNYDFGRMQRQQRFLTALREQAMGWNLWLDLPGVIDALFSNLHTTLGTNDIVKLAYWGVKLDGSKIRQVSVVGDIQTIGKASYVIPAEGAVEEAVNELMTPPSATGAGQTTASGQGTDASTTTTASAGVDTSEFITDPDKIENSVLWHDWAATVPFQVMAPGYLPEGYAYVDSNPPRQTGGSYDIVVGDEVEAALKMVYQLTRQGEPTDQYMGIMQTTWLDAPAASEGREVEYNGITYTIVGTSQSTDHVWWKQDGVLYWVSNTLSYYLNSTELVKVAASMIVVPSGAAD